MSRSLAKVTNPLKYGQVKHSVKTWERACLRIPTLSRLLLLAGAVTALQRGDVVS